MAQTINAAGHLLATVQLLVLFHLLLADLFFSHKFAFTSNEFLQVQALLSAFLHEEQARFTNQFQLYPAWEPDYLRRLA
jgi:hypothetical protein